MKALLTTLALSSTSLVAGEATIKCSTIDLFASPYLTFDFKLQSKEGRAVFADPKHAIVHVSSLPSYSSETIPHEQVLPRCEKAHVRMEDNRLLIECDDDGDSGFGELNIIENGGVAYGKWNSAEGFRLSDGSRFIENLNWQLICRFY